MILLGLVSRCYDSLCYFFTYIKCKTLGNENSPLQNREKNGYKVPAQRFVRSFCWISVSCCLVNGCLGYQLPIITNPCPPEDPTNRCAYSLCPFSLQLMESLIPRKIALTGNKTSLFQAFGRDVAEKCEQEKNSHFPLLNAWGGCGKTCLLSISKIRSFLLNCLKLFPLVF